MASSIYEGLFNSTTGLNALQSIEYLNTCLQQNTIPVTIQNATSWEKSGCNLGFYCQNNNATLLPQFCPPLPACQEARLSGRTCPPMGPLEPVICSAGYYCPPGGAQKIQCPQGHFCRQGVTEPSKCSVGASCPPGSNRDMTFLPLLILIIVDVLMILMIVIAKLRTRWCKTNQLRKQKEANRKTCTQTARRRHRQYEELDNFQYNAHNDEEDVDMEARMIKVRNRGTGFEEIMEPEFDVYDEFAEKDAPSTDLQLFVQSLSKCIGATKFGLNFEFEDLKFQPSKSTKPILSQVSGSINSGSLWGVMGASGAGKSTFVNVLMGKTPHTGGVTKVNGIAGNISKYKKIIGYVPQDDIVLPELTVRENILHSARIRLPCTWTDDEIQHHVDILVSCLQLDHVKDSLVGSTAAPVISGGQRKRVSIGIELAAAPMALFLDEPTSGLDATSAASIMTTLKALSRLGITIVTIIHQPRQEIFESLDSLVLLGAGRMIYHGPQLGVQPHFEHLGFEFPEHGNPADIMGDIIAGEGRLYKHKGNSSVQFLIDSWERQESKLSNHADTSTTSVTMAETNALNATIKTRGAEWYRQIYYCMNRSLIQQYRVKSSFIFELGTGALAGFLIGLAEFNEMGSNFRGIYVEPYGILSSSIDYGSVPQMALLVGLSIGLTASAPGVKIFGEEKLVYWREAAAGHNRFAYYIGKVISTFPRILLSNFHFTTMFLLLSTPRISWPSAFIANLLYFYCVYGLASCISMVVRREDGPLLAVMSSLIVGVLNGMSPSLSKVEKWHVVWIWRASPGTWLAEGYFTENISTLRYLYQIDLAEEGTGYSLGGFTLDLLMLLALGTIYRVIAFVGLRFMYRHKQR